MEQLGSAVEQQDEDVQEGNPLRYVPCIDGEAAANDGQLLHPDHTRLNPRPMCGRRSRFSTLGSISGYRGQYFASGTPGMHQTDGNPAEVRNFLVFCSVCIFRSRMDIMMSIRVSFVVSDPTADQPSFLRSPGGRVGRGSRRGRGVCGLWSVVCVSVSWCPFRGLWMGGEEEEEQQQQQELEEEQEKPEQVQEAEATRSTSPSQRTRRTHGARCSTTRRWRSRRARAPRWPRCAARCRPPPPMTKRTA